MATTSTGASPGAPRPVVAGARADVWGRPGGPGGRPDVSERPVGAAGRSRGRAEVSGGPPGPRPTVTDSSPDARAVAAGERGLLLAVASLVVTACLPLARVYVGLDFLRVVVVAALLGVALPSGARRLGAGPLPALLASAAGWWLFASRVFAGETLMAGLLPTPATWDTELDLWRRGIELMYTRPAPTLPEPAMLFVTVTGVWAVAHAVEGSVFRLRAPVKAVLVAMVLWAIPLALAPYSDHVWFWSAPFLGASGAVLIAFAGADLARWGNWVDPWTGGALRNPRSAGLGRNPLARAGALLSATALIGAGLAAGRLPGFGEDPWYQLRGRGETAVTTNPIVNIRTRLVGSSSGPLLRVRTTRPLYLRTTSLDVYSDREEWTNGGIRGDLPAGPFIPFEVEIGPAEPISVEVEALRLERAVLAPVPYQAARMRGAAAAKLRYDPALSTFTVAAGMRLAEGDRYEVLSAVPAPDARMLNRVPARDPQGLLTALPPSVPPTVARLARQIVERADAGTSFEQALAIQRELRSWEYSLEPPQGHSSQAMEAFLESRVGYCEQYAGTMAVMLRTLGVPARVAVGFTPGRLIRDPDDATPTAERVADDVPDVYLVSASNAHAWVEVLFPGLGWIAFEPTPRDDGNVLVPSGANLAPTMTLAQASGELDGVLSAADERLLLRQEAEAAADREALEALDSAVGGGGVGGGLGLWPWALGAMVMLAAGLAVARRRRAPAAPGGTPAMRVLHAHAGVERIGRGLGLPPEPSETDREYLERVAPGHGSARVLAARTAQARYAASVEDAAADDAHRASAHLVDALLTDLHPLRRRVVPLFGWCSLRLAQVRDQLRLRSRRPPGEDQWPSPSRSRRSSR